MPNTEPDCIFCKIAAHQAPAHWVYEDTQAFAILDINPLSRGHCLVCGACATLGELRGNDQEKHLRCGTYGADRQFDRIRCTFCGNSNYKSLSYFSSEKEHAKHSIEISDQCHGCLKIISAFSPTPVELLAVEDLTTLHLDYIAQERGYARVAVQYAGGLYGKRSNATTDPGIQS